MNKWLKKSIDPATSLATPVEWRRRCFELAYRKIYNLPPMTMEEFFVFWNAYLDELIGPDIRQAHDVENMTEKDILPIFYSLMEYACGEYI